MPKCGYCGRETEGEATHCAECGTAFSSPSSGGPRTAPRDWTWLEWLRYLLSCVGFVLLFGFIYLLSFGPVAAYCCKVTTRTTRTTMGDHGTAYTIVHTIQVPHWVGVLYRPAILLRGGSDPTGLYDRYLSWWAKRPQKP